MNEEKIGYLIAKVEEQGADLKKITDRFEALEEMVQDKFKTAETVLRVLKWIVGSIFAVVTLPWDRIKVLVLSLWK